MKAQGSRFFKNALSVASRLLGDKLRTQKMLKKAESKAENPSTSFPSGIFDKLKVMIRMIRAYINGKYRTVPWGTIVKLTAALIYFIMPVDLIPDLIPVTGLIDDFTLILWVWSGVESDVVQFLDWERSLD